MIMADGLVVDLPRLSERDLLAIIYRALVLKGTLSGRSCVPLQTRLTGKPTNAVPHSSAINIGFSG